MQIRQATAEDLDDILHLAFQVHAIHMALFPHIFKPAVGEEMRSYFADTLAEANARIFLAHDDDTPLGYLLLRIHEWEENTFCHARRLIYVEHICVDEKHRHRGVGSRLVEAVRALARDLGISRVELDFWFADRDAGCAFRAMGFQTYNEKMFMEVE